MRLLVLALLVPLLLAASTAEAPRSTRSDAARERVTPRLERELRESGLTLGSAVFLRIYKDEGTLEAWVDDGERFQRFRSYPICTFSGGLGPKQKTGDRQAPEGAYFVTPGRMNPWSSFHLSFDLGYPNAFDRAHGRTGSYLMVHGDCVSIGCYAMTDPAIEELWTLMLAAFEGGQPYVRVHAAPFRLTAQNLDAHEGSRWIDFWRNLAEGAAIFDATGHPPDASVGDGRYVFTSTAPAADPGSARP